MKSGTEYETHSKALWVREPKKCSLFTMRRERCQHESAIAERFGLDLNISFSAFPSSSETKADAECARNRQITVTTNVDAVILDSP